MMMIHKTYYSIAVLAAMAGPGSAFATSCVTSSGYNELSGLQITKLLVGSIACYPVAAPYRNQEILSGGAITDYKKGPGDRKDPSKVIGTYSVSNTVHAAVGYAYKGGPIFTYTVWGTATSGSGIYDFCVGTVAIKVRVAAGSSGPC